MSKELRAFAVGMVFLVASCTDGSGEPADTAPSGNTTAATGWVPYTSERFGYTLDMPEGWVYTPATEDWPVDVYPAGGSAYGDSWALPPGPFPVVDIYTQPLPQDRTEAEFLDWLDTENAKICTVESTEEVVVDGATGRLQRQTCGYNAYEVAVVDGRQVYLFYWIGGEVEDRATLEAILATFRFAPGSDG